MATYLMEYQGTFGGVAGWDTVNSETVTGAKIPSGATIQSVRLRLNARDSGTTNLKERSFQLTANITTESGTKKIEFNSQAGTAGYQHEKVNYGNINIEGFAASQQNNVVTANWSQITYSLPSYPSSATDNYRVRLGQTKTTTNNPFTSGTFVVQSTNTYFSGSGTCLLYKFYVDVVYEYDYDVDVTYKCVANGGTVVMDQLTADGRTAATRTVAYDQPQQLTYTVSAYRGSATTPFATTDISFTSTKPDIDWANLDIPRRVNSQTQQGKYELWWNPATHNDYGPVDQQILYTVYRTPDTEQHGVIVGSTNDIMLLINDPPTSTMKYYIVASYGGASKSGFSKSYEWLISLFRKVSVYFYMPEWGPNPP